MELREKRPQRRCTFSSTGITPPGLIEVGLIEVSARAAGNSPPTASAVETPAAKNEHEDDDDQKGSAIHDRLLAETALRLGMITNPSSNSTRAQTLQS